MFVKTIAVLQLELNVYGMELAVAVDLLEIALLTPTQMNATTQLVLKIPPRNVDGTLLPTDAHVEPLQLIAKHSRAERSVQLQHAQAMTNHVFGLQMQMELDAVTVQQSTLPAALSLTKICVSTTSAFKMATATNAHGLQHKTDVTVLNNWTVQDG